LDDAGEELREALALAPDGRVLGDLPERLGDAVDQLRVHARTCHSDAKDAGDDGTAGARKAVRAGLQEIIDVCERAGGPGGGGSVPPPRTTWSRSPIPRPRDAPSSRSRRSAWPGPCAGRSWRIAPPC